jgi:sec-independent protein translocase protein TatA
MVDHVARAGVMGMGTQELIIIFLILFLLFGASRLPQLGSSLGSAIRNFKKGFSAGELEDKPEEKKLSETAAEKTTVTKQG